MLQPTKFQVRALLSRPRMLTFKLSYISFDFVTICYRHWAQNNPFWVGQVNEVAPAKVMAWTGILDTEIIGPFFFDAHVNGETYLEMLNDFVMPELLRKRLDPNDICYMHDGAPPHITRDVRAYLDQNFLSWIGRGDGENKFLAWPPRSPDLNPLDFFLWGHLQHRVHMFTYDSVHQMTNAVVREAQEISEHTLQRVQANMVKRLHACIRENGHLFEHKLK